MVQKNYKHFAKNKNKRFKSIILRLTPPYKPLPYNIMVIKTISRSVFMKCDRTIYGHGIICRTYNI